VEVAHQVCILYAVIGGYLNELDVAQVPEFEKALRTFMDEKHFDVLQAIRESGKLEPETEQKLKDALSALKQDFVAKI